MARVKTDRRCGDCVWLLTAFEGTSCQDTGQEEGSPACPSFQHADGLDGSFRQHPVIVEALREVKSILKDHKEDSLTITEIASTSYDLPRSYKDKNASNKVQAQLSVALSTRSVATRVMVASAKRRSRVASKRSEAEQVVSQWPETRNHKHVADRTAFVSSVLLPFDKALAKLDTTIYACREVVSLASSVVDTVEATTRAHYAVKKVD